MCQFVERAADLTEESLQLVYLMYHGMQQCVIALFSCTLCGMQQYIPSLLSTDNSGDTVKKSSISLLIWALFSVKHMGSYPGVLD